MSRSRISRKSLLVLASSWALSGLLWTQHTIYIPAGSQAIDLAAQKLMSELEEVTAANWQVSTQSPNFVGGVWAYAIRVDDPAYTPTDPNWTDTSYHVKSKTGVGFKPYHVELHSDTEQGALEGLHGLRMGLRTTAPYLPILPYDTVVNPAFKRRGFMVLLAESTFTAEEWRDYIDYHQLLGANTLTVGLPGLHADRDPAVIERFAADESAAKAAMDYCHEVGMWFQVIVGANGMDRRFFWDNFEPEKVLYDIDGVSVSNPTTPFAAVDPVGATTDHLSHTNHELAYYAGSASFDKLQNNGMGLPVEADLQALQLPFFQTFADADSFLIVTTESASDYSELMVNGPSGDEAISQNFSWVSERIDAGNPGSDAQISYWGWLHDVWFRARLDDHNYSLHPKLAQGFPQDSFDEVLTQFQDHDTRLGNPAGASREWVQESGAFYGVIPPWAGVVGSFGGAVNAPRHLVDPLGELDERVDPGDFEKTAFLYWTHLERDVRNSLPRPAAQAMIVDMRLALRKSTDGTPVFASNPATPDVWDSDWLPASGVMGYRFLTPKTRPLNDYVVLRCASDRNFLRADQADMTLTELSDARDEILEDLARFLAWKKPTDKDSIRDSLLALDRARPNLDGAIGLVPLQLEASLSAFSQSGAEVYWWDHGPELQDYYLLLAFTVFIEKAATATGTAYDDYVDAAIRVAKQTPLLDQYNTGHEAQVRALVEQLIALF